MVVTYKPIYDLPMQISRSEAIIGLSGYDPNDPNLIS